jgi:PAS domain S-box-containing protein
MVNNNFDKIFDLYPAPSAILLPDAPKFTFAGVNQAYLAITGLTRNDILGKGYFDIFPHYRAEALAVLEKVVRDKKAYQTPTKQYSIAIPGTAISEYRYLDALNTPVLNDDGEVELIIRSGTDVTSFIATQRNEEVSRHQFQSLVQTVEGIVWEADVETLQFNFVSDKVKSLLGYSPEEWLSAPYFWENHIHPDDREHAVHYCHVQTQECRNHTFDYRMIDASGGTVWIKDIVTVITESGRPKLLRGLMVDITPNKRLGELDRLEKDVLQLTAQKDMATQNILLTYLQGIEALYPQIKVSLLTVKSDHLFNWVSPSLPKSFLADTENIALGESNGSCAAAAFLKKAIVVTDIDTHACWANHKELALPYKLDACAAYPIISADGDVMAALGFYYSKDKLPGDEEQNIMERSSAILQVILENRRNYDIIQENTMLMAQGQELANFGNWRWDIINDVVRWSDTLYHIYGLDRDSFKATFEGYQELLHPDDRLMVYNHIQNVLETKNDVMFEERIIRPNGETRFLRSWGRLKTDENGTPIRMIGACLDVTESKLAEQRLQELHEELEDHLSVLALSEKNYSDLFHLSPIPMWVFDPDTLLFLNVNASAIQHYGYTQQEFLTMSLKDIRPATENAKLEAAVGLSRSKTNGSHPGIFKHRKKNGDEILVDIRSNVINFNGRSALLVLANDVTERLNYTAAIEKQNKNLQDIAWIQSHVVRAPLARIMGLVELFKHYKSTDMDKRQLLDHILTSAIELDGLVKEISSKTEKIWLSNTITDDGFQKN